MVQGLRASSPLVWSLTPYCPLLIFLSLFSSPYFPLLIFLSLFPLLIFLFLFSSPYFPLYIFLSLFSPPYFPLLIFLSLFLLSLFSSSYFPLLIFLFLFSSSYFPLLTPYLLTSKSSTHMQSMNVALHPFGKNKLRQHLRTHRRENLVNATHVIMSRFV